MRFLAGLLSIIWLLAPAAQPAHADNEIVLDDGAPSVQSSGTWATASATSGFVGDGYHYRVAGDGTNTFTWPFTGPAGRYEVFARWTSGENRASNATYVVTNSTGSAPVSADQRSNGGAWRSLGTFDFSSSPSGQGVRLSDRADGIVIADAVRWVPSQNAAPTQNAAPSQNPAPTQNAVATQNPAPATNAAADPRFFSETNFRVGNDAFWDFFQKRGGVRTFGFPVSRDFTFFGCRTQLFQRLAMQQCGDASAGVGTLNVLDAGFLPYSHFHGSTLPAPDPQLIAGAPLPSQPDYASKAIEFVRANTPESFNGEPVKFLSTFNSTVTLSDAFPDGNGDAGLLPLLNLQLWGMPTSPPAIDPNNHDFVYQRFQRGVMHYDKGCQCTQALLLTDYLKGLLTGNLLPDDLAAEAASSELLRAIPAHRDLRSTNFADAFTVQTPQAPPPPAAAPAPAAPATPVATTSPDYGMSVFLWGHPDTTPRDLKLITDVGFRWQKTLFQWRAIEGGCKGCYDWTEADRVVKASSAAGVQTIARLDFQPTWARKDGATNGPPDNYQDYADFVSAFVSRYGAPSTIGRVAAIEVWNEVNLDREWGGATINKQQAQDYVRLLTGAYTAAKKADPSVTVISAGLSPTGATDGHSADDVTYLQWLFDAGMKGHYDVLGAHGNTQAPEVEAAPGSLKEFPHGSFYFRRVEQLRDVMVKNGDADKHVWLLEFGWTSDAVHPNYSWFAVSEDKKASNIVKALQYATQNWRPWIGVMTLWTLPDPAWNNDREEYWWAITNADGTPRAAYTALLQARRGGVLAGITTGT